MRMPTLIKSIMAFDRILIDLTKERKSIIFYNNWEREPAIFFHVDYKPDVYDTKLKIGKLRITMTWVKLFQLYIIQTLFSEMAISTATLNALGVA